MNTIHKALFSILILISLGLNAQNRSINIVSQNNSCVVIDFTLSNFSIEDTILDSNYNVNQTFNYIKIDDINYGIIDSLGWPEIPQLTFNVCLPYNATNITVNFVSNNDTLFSIPHQILPKQEHIVKDSSAVYDYTMDTTCYNSYSWVYSGGAIVTNEYYIFGAKGIAVTTLPFAYNPSISLIKAFLSGRITISYTLDDGIEEFSRRFTKATENYLNSFFVNFSAKNTNLSKARYLMIVDSSYRLTLNRFANYKMNAGYDVQVVTTQETGGDVWSIKAYIQGLYDNVNTRPEFILLAGDANTIPISAGSDGIESDPITDLNYSRLDGEDYFADVFLGRFPINNNYQLNNIINKTIHTETNLQHYYDIAYLIAGDSDESWLTDWWWRIQFEIAHDYIIRNTFVPLEFNWHRLYQPNINQVANALSNSPKYFIYSGHGSYRVWAGVSFSLYKNSIPQIFDNIYPFVFAFACRTGDFYRYDTDNECIGKSWMIKPNGGASIYFGSSIKTTTDVDINLEKHIFYNDFQNLESMSAIVNNGKAGYWNSFWGPLSHRKWYMKAYNLLGDPSIQVNGIDGCFDSYVFYFPEHYSYYTTEYVANTKIKNESDYVINSGSYIVWKAGEVIKLKPGFHAKAGSHFTAAIESCDRSIYYELDNKIENYDNTNTVYESEYMDSKEVFNIYPNPTINEIVLSYFIEKDDDIVVSISNIQGKTTKLFSGVKKRGKYIEHYSVANLPSGIYVISIITSQNQYIKKIIKQ